MIGTLVGYAIAISYLAIFVKRFLQRKDFVTILFLSFIIVPTVDIGNFHLALTYFWMVLFAVAIVSGKINLRVNQNVFRYCICSIILILLYILASVVNNTTGISGIIASILTNGKFIILVVEAALLIQAAKLDNKGLEISLKKALIIALFINTVAIFMQIFIPAQATKLLDTIFFREESLNQLDAIQNGEIFRLSGIFHFPALSGVFSLLSVCAFLPTIKQDKKSWIGILMALFSGFSSMSKTFYIGVFMILIFWLFQNIYKIKKQTIITILASAAVLVLFFANSDAIIDIAYDINPIMGYYVSTIFDLDKALMSRYDENTGTMLATMDVISEYWLIGVGPKSLRGEFIGDNGFLLILHNAGIIGMSFVGYFYVCIFKRAWKSSNNIIVLLVFTILITAMGYNSIWFNMITIAFIVYMVMYRYSVKALPKHSVQ